MAMENTLLSDIDDTQVDAALDGELRHLLVTCFVKDEPVFSKHRHFVEPPQHRWLVRDSGGRLIAQTAVHDKIIGSTQGDLHIAGIAEVCVHPDARGHGLVRVMMHAVEKWAKERPFDFCMLFGSSKVYSSSGYKLIDNPIRRFNNTTQQWEVRPNDFTMILPLSGRAWPEGEIDLRGPFF